MNTIILNAVTDEAAEIIRNGGLVAFPTETVYGLGGNAFDPDASRKIYAAKGRPSDNPLIVHICDIRQLYDIAAEVPEMAKKLAERFWPGPMTMVLRKNSVVPDETTGGLDTVAVRFPVHPMAQELIRRSGVPIAAPSANTSGRPSPTLARHVIDDMNGRIDCIIDGGPCEIGLESTIVDVTGEKIALLRPGKITVEDLKECAGEVEIDPAILRPMQPGERPKAPGMKYKHYAPKAELTIVKPKAESRQKHAASTAAEFDSGRTAPAAAEFNSGKNNPVVRTINRFAHAAEKEGKRCGIIATKENAAAYDCGVVKVIGSHLDESSVSHNLFAILREFDEEGVDRIFSESFSDMAIMNRLSKAAGYDIIEADD